MDGNSDSYKELVIVVIITHAPVVCTQQSPSN